MHKKFFRLISKRFCRNQFCFYVTVEKIDHGILSVSCGPYILECTTDLDISKIKISDQISILCVGQCCPEKLAVQFKIQTYTFGPDLNLKSYDRYIKNCLRLSKFNRPARPPDFISNIGVINLDSGLTQKFVLLFQKCCAGTLYIYHVNQNEIGYDFVNAMNYFSKYHQINMICCISGRFDPPQLFDLSSDYSITHAQCQIFTLNVSETPVTYAAAMPNKRLSVMLAVNYIRQIQTNFKTKIQSALRLASLNSSKQIVMYQAQLADLTKFIIQTKLFSRVSIGLTIIQFLDNQLEKLYSVRSTMLKNIIT